MKQNILKSELKTGGGKRMPMLTLPIKAKWYGMLLSGEKKEEYRSLSSYWEKRFRNVGLFRDAAPKAVRFRNGYSSDSRSFVAKVQLKIGSGNPQWGAKESEKYFVLTIVEIVDMKPVVVDVS